MFNLCSLLWHDWEIIAEVPNPVAGKTYKIQSTIIGEVKVPYITANEETVDLWKCKRCGKEQLRQIFVDL